MAFRALGFVPSSFCPALARQIDKLIEYCRFLKGVVKCNRVRR